MEQESLFMKHTLKTIIEKILLYFGYCYKHKCWLFTWTYSVKKCLKGTETYYG